MRQIGKKQPIAPLGRKPPIHRIHMGSKVVEEQIPATPYTRKFVDPDGMVKRVVLATGRTIGGTVDNPYGNAKLAQKLAAGWLPYSQCPVGRHGLWPGETPCEGSDPAKPGQFSKPHPTSRYALIEDDCCKHIEQAIRERRAEHEERQREFKKQFVNSMDKLVEHMEKQMAAESKFAQPEQDAHAAVFGTDSGADVQPRDGE